MKILRNKSSLKKRKYWNVRKLDREEAKRGRHTDVNNRVTANISKKDREVHFTKVYGGTTIAEQETEEVIDKKQQRRKVHLLI